MSRIERVALSVDMCTQNIKYKRKLKIRPVISAKLEFVATWILANDMQ